MSHDIVADALNMMKNAKMSGKTVVRVRHLSNLLIELLKIMKEKKIIKKYKINSKERTIDITLGDFFDCRAVKPRFTVKADQIEKYRRRYLPARNIGTLVVSTNKGLKTHEEAQEEQIGGCLIAYFY